MLVSIRISGVSDNASGQRVPTLPATASASRTRSWTASEWTYPGGSAIWASRSWTERSAPIWGPSVLRHHLTLAVSIASGQRLSFASGKP